jgi:hypothetical protein
VIGTFFPPCVVLLFGEGFKQFEWMVFEFLFGFGAVVLVEVVRGD